MSRPPLLVIAAGGTGGHMFPAQALAEEMLARGWRVRLSTDPRGARYADQFPEAVERRVTSSGTFSRGDFVARLLAPFAIAAGLARTLLSMMRDRPDCVAGFGGYPALPATAAATLLRIPRVIHEQNGVLGRVNRFFAARVDRVACGIWPTALPPGATPEYVGNPVRGTVLALAATPYCVPEGGTIELLLIGGSQGAGVFSKVMPDAMEKLPYDLRDRIRLSQQVRPEDIEHVLAEYDRLDIDAELRSFFEDLPERLARASLVISRAGAGSIADITVMGRPAILVPYPTAADDHQTANAAGLVEAGGAFVIPERDLTPTVLAGHISAILSDPEGAAAMAAVSRAQGRPEATRHLADLVETLAEQGKRA
ncbi:MAG: UDP-N-acetylglucosamine--N-acetylmuramyl-(pentapeptide) pyrophosphoryl-undecaprenol N-acetylglucosamine transferase [Pseudomonadota bacterium]